MGTASTASEDEPGVIQPILGLLVSLGFVAVGLYVWNETGDTKAVLFIGGMGALFVVLASYSVVTSIQALETYDPIHIVRADMNGWRKMIKGFVALPLFWVFALYVLGSWSPSEAVRIVARIRSNQPELLVGFVGFNVLMILGIMFGSRSRAHHV